MTLPSSIEQLPLADNPRLVARMLDLVAQGVRSSRGLQEGLGCDTAQVQKLLHAAEWLGFLGLENDIQLTASGIEFVYAGKNRAKVFAQTVQGQPIISLVLRSYFESHTSDSSSLETPSLLFFQEQIQSLFPSATRHQVMEHTKSLYSLIAPAIRRSKLAGFSESQLELPLTAKPSIPEPARFALIAGREYNPDVYRFILCALLDHGELSLGQIRALLDRAHVTEAPLGGYVDIAIRRGDAVRVEERLVCTPSAIEYRELAESTASIALSDPSYRAYLQDLISASQGNREAQIRFENARVRFHNWDKRLFGEELLADGMEQALSRVLLDRSLDAFPMVRGPGLSPRVIKDAFLDVWEERGLSIAFPPTLATLRHGIDAMNRSFRNARHGSQDVTLPDIASRPFVYHAGILHPGEPLPKAISDLRSLRLRLLMHSPYPAMLTALLLLHRGAPERIELQMLRGRIHLHMDRQDLGDVLDVLDQFARFRGWLPCRRRVGIMRSPVLIQILESVNISVRTFEKIVLAERFFVQLRTEADESEVHRRLQKLAENLFIWLESQQMDVQNADTSVELPL